MKRARSLSAGSVSPEKPLHVRVAEALGWTQLAQDVGEWWGRGPEGTTYRSFMNGSSCGYPSYNNSGVPLFDTDWAVTGPLIEQLRVDLTEEREGLWGASSWNILD